MYRSPITIIESTIDSFTKSIIKQKDDAIFAEIQHSFGVDVDEKELIRALQYDRNQYEKGYADAKAEEKHGRWEEQYKPNGNYISWDGYYCSACGKQAAKSNYCPNCGADMRERKEEAVKE